jgi:hypothetical protein
MRAAAAPDREYSLRIKRADAIMKKVNGQTRATGS